MTLYLIGLGLDNEQDITQKGLTAIQQSDTIYYEEYTSRLQTTVDALEQTYKKTITKLSREQFEQHIPTIVKEAKHHNVSVLIIGSPLAATTHFEFILESHKHKIPYEIIDNASIYTAIAHTGLFLYKFGRTTTIPFDNEHITSLYDTYMNNKKLGLHTLFLLDITTDSLMTVRQALDYLITKGLDKNTLCVGCGALGSKKQEIKTGTAETLTIEHTPQSLIIPGELNFKEEEALALWKQ